MVGDYTLNNRVPLTHEEYLSLLVDSINDVLKQIRSLARKKVKNPTAKAWIADQMQLRGITKVPSGRNIGKAGGQGAGRVTMPGSAGFKTKMGRKRPKTGRYAKK